MEACAAVFQEVTERAIACWPRGRPFSVHERLERLTLDVILEVVFGPGDPTERRSLREDLTELLRGMTHPILLLPWAHVDLGPLTAWGRLVRLRDSIDRRIHDLIAARRAEARWDRLDVLTQLAGARDQDGGPLSRKVLRDEIVTLSWQGTTPWLRR